MRQRSSLIVCQYTAVHELLGAGGLYLWQYI